MRKDHKFNLIFMVVTIVLTVIIACVLPNILKRYFNAAKPTQFTK